MDRIVIIKWCASRKALGKQHSCATSALYCTHGTAYAYTAQYVHNSYYACAAEGAIVKVHLTHSLVGM